MFSRDGFYFIVDFNFLSGSRLPRLAGRDQRFCLQFIFPRNILDRCRLFPACLRFCRRLGFLGKCRGGSGFARRFKWCGRDRREGGSLMGCGDGGSRWFFGGTVR